MCHLYMFEISRYCKPFDHDQFKKNLKTGPWKIFTIKKGHDHKKVGDHNHWYRVFNFRFRNFTWISQSFNSYFNNLLKPMHSDFYDSDLILNQSPSSPQSTLPFQIHIQVLVQRKRLNSNIKFISL